MSVNSVQNGEVVGDSFAQKKLVLRVEFLNFIF